MFNLIKYEFKGRSKFIAMLLTLYLLEHIYMSFFKFNNIKVYGSDVLGATIILNMIITTLIFLSILFIYNILEYSKLLNPQPGYMLFMGSISKVQIIFSKLITMFIELLGIGILSFFIFIFQGRIFNIFEDNFLSYLFLNLDLNSLIELIFLTIKLIVYYASNFLIGISIIILAITLRKFLFKERKFAGLITFFIAIFIFVLKKHIYSLFNINFISNTIIGHNMNHSHLSSSNFSSGILFLNFVLGIGIFYLTAYLLENKIDI